ncbi:hypothetical protein D3C80_1516390 [compost metagenome]
MIVLRNPAELKIALIAHARQIEGRCGQYLLTGNVLQALPRSGLPASRNALPAPWARRERRGIKMRQARCPKRGIIDAGGINSAKMQRFCVAQQRQYVAYRQATGLRQRVCRLARAISAQKRPDPHYAGMGGDIPTVCVDLQQRSRFACILTPHSL